jgi:hypothetical protein
MPLKKGVARRRHAPSHPLLCSSLEEQHEPSHPSPSSSSPRQCPRHGRTSLLTVPPLQPPRPRDELHLPGFSAQISLPSSPPLCVRCCRSSSQPPPIVGARPPPVNTVVMPLLHPHLSSHFLIEHTIPSFHQHPGGASWCSPAEPCRWPATAMPWVTSSVGPGRQAKAQPACWLATCGKPPCPMGHSPRPDRAQHCARVFKTVSICFK